MHKINIIAALMLAAAPLAANAADGTITFNGKVTDKTCTISTPGGKDFAVTLPTVSKNTLATAGAVAGRT
ncbi:type 1 fimbrial protein, partial [Klebsiella pneumoniae]|nr:type 1 fimbrial protein [Klebsiella pneumoniae]